MTTRDPLQPSYLTCELWGFVGLVAVLLFARPRPTEISFTALCGAYGIMAGGRSHVKAKAAGKSELLEGTILERKELKVELEPGGSSDD